MKRGRSHPPTPAGNVLWTSRGPAHGHWRPGGPLDATVTRGGPTLADVTYLKPILRNGAGHRVGVPLRRPPLRLTARRENLPAGGPPYRIPNTKTSQHWFLGRWVSRTEPISLTWHLALSRSPCWPKKRQKTPPHLRQAKAFLRLRWRSSRQFDRKIPCPRSRRATNSKLGRGIWRSARGSVRGVNRMA